MGLVVEPYQVVSRVCEQGSADDGGEIMQLVAGEEQVREEPEDPKVQECGDEEARAEPDHVERCRERRQNYRLAVGEVGLTVPVVGIPSGKPSRAHLIDVVVKPRAKIDVHIGLKGVLRCRRPPVDARDRRRLSDVAREVVLAARDRRPQLDEREDREKSRDQQRRRRTAEVAETARLLMRRQRRRGAGEWLSRHGKVLGRGPGGVVACGTRLDQGRCSDGSGRAADDYAEHGSPRRSGQGHSGSGRFRSSQRDVDEAHARSQTLTSR